MNPLRDVDGHAPLRASYHVSALETERLCTADHSLLSLRGFAFGLAGDLANSPAAARSLNRRISARVT